MRAATDKLQRWDGKGWLKFKVSRYGSGVLETVASGLDTRFYRHEWLEKQVLSQHPYGQKTGETIPYLYVTRA